jgi:hypothetical protein
VEAEPPTGGEAHTDPLYDVAAFYNIFLFAIIVNNFIIIIEAFLIL